MGERQPNPADLAAGAYQPLLEPGYAVRCVGDQAAHARLIGQVVGVGEVATASAQQLRLGPPGERAQRRVDRNVVAVFVREANRHRGALENRPPPALGFPEHCLRRNCLGHVAKLDLDGRLPVEVDPPGVDDDFDTPAVGPPQRSSVPSCAPVVKRGAERRPLGFEVLGRHETRHRFVDQVVDPVQQGGLFIRVQEVSGGGDHGDGHR